VTRNLPWHLTSGAYSRFASRTLESIDSEELQRREYLRERAAAALRHHAAAASGRGGILARVLTWRWRR
jgi:hypothetical protein